MSTSSKSYGADPRPANDSHRPVVLLLSHSAQLSGAEILLERLAGAFHRIQPLVVLGENGPIEEKLRVRGVEYAIVPFPRAHPHAGTLGRRLRRFGETVRCLMRLCALVRARRPDAIYTHSVSAHVVGGVVGALQNVPVVQHQHVVLDRRLHGPLTRVAYRLTATLLASAIIANSRASLASLGAWRRHAAAAAIPPTLPYQPVQRAVVEDEVRDLVIAGRLSEQKGQDIAVRAFARARSRLHPAARLHIVGDAVFPRDERFKADLIGLIDSLDLADAVLVHGQRCDVEDVLAKADVCLHAARWPEGFGMVVAEAMAVGTPVISSRLGGPGEIITDERDGLLVDADPDELAAALVRVSADAELRRSLVSEGLRTATHFRAEKVAAVTESMLLHVIRDRRER